MPLKKTARNKSGKSNQEVGSARRWSNKVDTDSTHPEPGLFSKAPRTIAKALASKKVSPKGPASGMRMLNFYINRAGKNLTTERIAALEKAKIVLSELIAKQKLDESADVPTKHNLPSKKASKKIST
jgi:tRNA(adenine34) deaminase